MRFLTSKLGLKMRAVLLAASICVFSNVGLASGEAAAEAGLPQLRTEFWVGQLFWLFVTFGITYLLMSRVALPSVRRAQEKRMSILKTELDAATAASDEARAIQRACEKSLAESRLAAQKMYNDVSTEISREAAEHQTKLQQKMAERLVEAEKRIQAVRDSALKDLDKVTKELAESVVQTVTQNHCGGAS